MKNQFLKLASGLALAAFFVGSFASSVNAQPVTMNELQITEVGNFDDLVKEKEWEFVSSEYVYRKTVTE